MTIDVRRSAVRLRPDARRVFARLFVPGHDPLVEGVSRAESVLRRILDLSERDVVRALESVHEEFSNRHGDLDAVLEEHALVAVRRLNDEVAVSAKRRQLIGAYFTQESAIQAAAVCNPSIVAHPEPGLDDDPARLRIIMSLRAIGEGHRSTIEFRSGNIDPNGALSFDDVVGPLVAGRPLEHPRSRVALARILAEVDGSRANFEAVLALLPDPYSDDDLRSACAVLRSQGRTRERIERSIETMLRASAAHYVTTFAPTTDLSQRVLMPVSADESHGIEDARFVRFASSMSPPRYLATYTAYDGTHVAPHLIETDDFVTFRHSKLTGRAARNKGMAIFPRPIGTDHFALTRWNRDSSDLCVSQDLTHWDTVFPLERSLRWWDLAQSGNCGSPIETEAGWLVLTHGVGPMRRYSIGAELLDLDDPTRSLGSLESPLLVPEADERDGYVPNVVYTCGAITHRDWLVIPFGVGDSSIAVATVRLDEVLAALTK
jgi:predicted GH43/DUF377 family glycosyl hydrolase